MRRGKWLEPALAGGRGLPARGSVPKRARPQCRRDSTSRHEFTHHTIDLWSSSSIPPYWCPDCRTAKRFLEKNSIPYTEVDIEKTPGAAEEVIRQTGKRAIPQFVIDGKWVQPYRPGEGFLYEEMSQLLGVVDEG